MNPRWTVPLVLALACTRVPEDDGGDTDTDTDTTPATCEIPEPRWDAGDDARTTTSADSDVAAWADDLTAFTVALHSALADGAAGNTLVSPWSIETFLVVAGLDAASGARTQIDDVVAPTQDLTAHETTTGLVLADTQAPPADRHGIVQHAVRLFHRPDDAPAAPWTTRAEDLGVGWEPVDFVALDDDARAYVNRWTEEQTACLIPELFGPGDVSSRTRTALVDALAVIADWTQPFEPSLTVPRPFTLADGSTVQADTMEGPAVRVGLAEADGTTVLRLPLMDPTLAVYAILPEEEDGLAALEGALDGPGLTALLDAPAETLVDLQFPKLSLRQRPDLPKLLRAVGLGDMAETSTDLGGLCPGCGGFTVLRHEAVFVADEEGIRAAAATGGGIDDSAGPELPLIQVDHPFLLVLRDEATGAPWFIGRVADPTKP